MECTAGAEPVRSDGEETANRSSGMGLCVCAALPCLCDPGEVLKVVSLCFRGAPGGGRSWGTEAYC